VLYVWFLSSFRGGCGYFLSFHRASCSLSNEARKNVVAAPKFRHDDKGKTAGICSEKKGKKSDGGCSCKVSFSLFGVEKILSFMMIHPLSSFQYPSSIQSLILTIFDSVLGPKKILRISPANLGYILPVAEFSALTLYIQMGISWASDIEIKWFKSPNSSTRLGLKL